MDCIQQKNIFGFNINKTGFRVGFNNAIYRHKFLIEIQKKTILPLFYFFTFHRNILTTAGVSAFAITVANN